MKPPVRHPYNPLQVVAWLCMFSVAGATGAAIVLLIAKVFP